VNISTTRVGEGALLLGGDGSGGRMIGRFAGASTTSGGKFDRAPWRPQGRGGAF
jgi:hypothetical protein